MNSRRDPTRSVTGPNWTLASTPSEPARVSPTPTCVTDSPTMRVKYSALNVMNRPLPNVETSVAAAIRRTTGWAAMPGRRSAI